MRITVRYRNLCKLKGSIEEGNIYMLVGANFKYILDLYAQLALKFLLYCGLDYPLSKLQASAFSDALRPQ
jgi:hypothetical protein